MRIVVTGAGGFLGRTLAPLLHDHEVVAVDLVTAPLEGFAHVELVEGDICDPSIIGAAFAGGCDAVVHLATIPSGAAEVDPARAKAVNLDGSLAVLEAAAAHGERPRVVFASSIAALGDALPERVDDDTPLAPRLFYGAHKAMIETWVSTLTRRAAMDGVSLRFPGIVARPRAPSGMSSAFLSELFHGLHDGSGVTLPVGPDATSWLISAPAAANAVVHALSTRGPTGPLTLPALHVRIGYLVAETARQLEADPSVVRYAPEPAIERGFGRYPPLVTPAADALGYVHDGSLEALVASVLETIAKEDAA